LFGANAVARRPRQLLARAARRAALAAGVAAGLAAGLAPGVLVPAGAAEAPPAPSAFPGAAARGREASVVLVAADGSGVQALDCVSGREIASLPPTTAQRASIALAPQGEAAFVATGDGLLRLRLPTLETTARSPLGFEASALGASGGDDAIVLAGAAGEAPLSARDPATLASLHEYRLDDGRSAAVASIIDLPGRSRFVVAFSDLEEIWEIDYRRDAPPVLRGLVHDYRMREAIELPGRFTPRVFRVAGATRALVAGAVPHEVLRIDAAGALGVLNLDVRREIERPAAGAVPAPERIAAWQGSRSRGWVLADDAGPALRVLDAAAWTLADPIPVDGEALAVAALDDGAVLLAFERGGRAVLARVDVESRSVRESSAPAPPGWRPYRLVRGTGGCTALVDARNRWIAGFRRETRAGAPGRGS